jgi:23S rRNA pseudouridine1911/1915/1917 synthase
VRHGLVVRRRQLRQSCLTLTSSRRRPSRLRLVAGAADAGASLARFVAVRGGIAPAEAEAAILRGGAFVAGRRVRDPSSRVRAGALVEVSLRAEDAAPALEPARLLHVDSDIVAVDKPAGVLAQEGRAGGASLLELCAAALRDRGEGGTALLVHRLDRGTTGVTVLARTRAAQAALLAAFREGAVEKEYRALVQGEPAEEHGTIDLALGSDPSAPGKRRADARGEPARTRWQLVERLRGRAHLAAFPETGRTHQVRVHLAAVGLPLLGDVRYGGPRALTRRDGARLEIARPLLHAYRLRVPHPREGTLDLEAPLPRDLLEAASFARVCD